MARLATDRARGDGQLHQQRRLRRAIVIRRDGNWQIYSASPTGDVFNGLDSGNTAVWNTTFGEPVTATGNRYIFAFQPTITVTSGDLAKSYGQDVTSLGGRRLHDQRPATGRCRRIPSRHSGRGLQRNAKRHLARLSRQGLCRGQPLSDHGRARQLHRVGRLRSCPRFRGRLTIDPLALTYSVADARSIFGTTPILGAATLFGVLPGDTVDPTVGAFRGVTPDPSESVHPGRPISPDS